MKCGDPIRGPSAQKQGYRQAGTSDKSFGSGHQPFGNFASWSRGSEGGRLHTRGIAVAYIRSCFSFKILADSITEGLEEQNTVAVRLVGQSVAVNIQNLAQIRMPSMIDRNIKTHTIDSLIATCCACARRHRCEPERQPPAAPPRWREWARSHFRTARAGCPV
jgi:hypothetical protein